MTWNVNIQGSNPPMNDDEHQAYEEDIVARAREFVAATEGVVSASVSGNKIGNVNLLLKEEA